jgi:hypothetical protein
VADIFAVLLAPWSPPAVSPFWDRVKNRQRLYGDVGPTFRLDSPSTAPEPRSRNVVHQHDTLDASSGAAPSDASRSFADATAISLAGVAAASLSNTPRAADLIFADIDKRVGNDAVDILELRNVFGLDSWATSEAFPGAHRSRRKVACILPPPRGCCARAISRTRRAGNVR